MLTEYGLQFVFFPGSHLVRQRADSEVRQQGWTLVAMFRDQTAVEVDYGGKA